jgi:hypothetical protein
MCIVHMRERPLYEEDQRFILSPAFHRIEGYCSRFDRQNSDLLRRNTASKTILFFLYPPPISVVREAHSEDLPEMRRYL